MTTMVEKVARAICLAANDGKTDEGFPMYEGLARAAIEAMKDPTEAMLDAGNDADGYDVYVGVWLAMIVSALKEEGQ